jgi:hypothetical protein
MLAFMVQFGSAHLRDTPGAPSSPVDSLILLLVAACVGALLVNTLGFLVPRARRKLRSRRGPHRRRDVVASERRARALMAELCPGGWRARIVVDATDSNPAGATAPVALEWAELEDESGQVAVSRRVWARTISEALDAMVADRETDETLEQIERGEAADGAPWPEL